MFSEKVLQDIKHLLHLITVFLGIVVIIFSFFSLVYHIVKKRINFTYFIRLDSKTKWSRPSNSKACIKKKF